ncbi:MAG: lytic transglycosylase domain-containing protein [Burkholderiales bacterium]|nr:lytic transglycosylase domain-containing protein [Burkholderiales bacterium]
MRVTKTAVRGESVYGCARRWQVLAPLALLSAFATSIPTLAFAAPAASADPATTVLDAREALRKRDRNRLAALRAQALAETNPLALWVEYWELSNRLGEAQQPELTAFAERWSGSYVEDRLRNDWLLELGRRRDWANFTAEFPRFRMNDDRQVTCYSLVPELIAGRDIKAAGIAAWLAQKEEDDGCALLAATLLDTRQLAPADIWKKIRLAAEANKPRVARQAAGLLGRDVAASVGEAFESPARFLTKKPSISARTDAELYTLALTRLAASDSESVAGLLVDRWEKALPPDLAAWAWASLARQNAQKLQPEAADQFLRAERANRKGKEIELPDDLLAWKVRAALRADGGKGRWQQVVQAIDAMSPAEQKDAAWIYWKARALQALAKDSQEGESLRASSREMLVAIAPQLNFYGQLAAEDLGQPQALPPKPAALTPAEREAVANHPGFNRALALIAIGLRSEGVREWNFSIRGLGDRELLAAAQLACDREVWDRCINTSDRTRAEIDMEQRFPAPHRQEVAARAKEIGLDPAFVYGLIRQESRFIMDARSGVGASGLMQLMPATAKWTAKKIGLPYSPALIADRDTNLRLGNAYLKLVLDDVGGSQAMAAAAYNAGPGRPRKWRDGPVLETAIWAENIPFAETRDYVKKVLSNSAYYALALGGKGTTIRSRLGRPVGPPDPNAPPLDKELP